MRASANVTPALAGQLRLLTGDDGRADLLVAGLHRMGGLIALAVPSWLDACVVVHRAGLAAVTVLAETGRTAPTLASVAVPLSAGEPSDLLVVRASQAGAFVLLADDLGALLGLGQAVMVDQHLVRPPGTSGAVLAEALAASSARHRALGALVARGATPEEASAELRRRAEAQGVPAAATARAVTAATRAGRPDLRRDEDPL